MHDHTKFLEREISYYCTKENSNQIESHFIDTTRPIRPKTSTFSILFVCLFI